MPAFSAALVPEVFLLFDIIAFNCIYPSLGSNDGRGTKEGAGQQQPPGEDEEEHGADHQRPADTSGWGWADCAEGGKETDSETGNLGQQKHFYFSFVRDMYITYFMD